MHSVTPDELAAKVPKFYGQCLATVQFGSLAMTSY